MFFYAFALNTIRAKLQRMNFGFSAVRNLESIGCLLFRVCGLHAERLWACRRVWPRVDGPAALVRAVLTRYVFWLICAKRLTAAISCLLSGLLLLLLFLKTHISHFSRNGIIFTFVNTVAAAAAVIRLWRIHFVAFSCGFFFWQKYFWGIIAHENECIIM